MNEEFDDVQENFVADKVEGYSSINNVPNDERMDSQVDPYPNEVRSYASSVAGELERLRYILSLVTGNDEWYQHPLSSIASIYGDLQALGLAKFNQISSGPVNAYNGPIALVPDGTAATVTLAVSGTQLVYIVDGLPYSSSTNESLTGLSLAPSTNNTAIVGSGDVGFAAGEDGTQIVIGTVGTEISSRVGQFAAFKVVHSAVTEYFVAYIESATTLSRAFRGFFFDHTTTPIPRVNMQSSDVITLMKLTWLFVKTDGTLDLTYNALAYGAIAPTSPAIGDFWYDSSNNVWKKYNGTTWNDSSSTLIGICIQDSTGTKASRTFEYFAAWQPQNSIYAEISTSASQAIGLNWGQKISVAGLLFDFGKSVSTWSTSGPFASGVTLAINTQYYMYITDSGEQILDTVKPYDRQDDLLGYYHPYNRWRAVGQIATDGSSLFKNLNSYCMPTRSPGYLGDFESIIGLDGFAINTTSPTSTTSNTAVAVSSLVIKTKGRPVELRLISNVPTNGSSASSVTTDAGGSSWYITRGDGTVDGVVATNTIARQSMQASTIFPSSVVSHIDWQVAGGIHTYKLWFKSDGTHTVDWSNNYFVAKEIN